MGVVKQDETGRRGGSREGSGRRQQWYKLPPEAADMLDELRYLQAIEEAEWGDAASREALLQVALTAYHQAVRRLRRQRVERTGSGREGSARPD